MQCIRAEYFSGFIFQAYVLCSCLDKILGVNDVTLIKPLDILAAAMFVPILLMIFGALAHDIQRQINGELSPTLT